MASFRRFALFVALTALFLLAHYAGYHALGSYYKCKRYSHWWVPDEEILHAALQKLANASRKTLDDLDTSTLWRANFVDKIEENSGIELPETGPINASLFETLPLESYKICIGIPSAPRPHARLDIVGTVVGGMMERMTPAQRAETPIIIFNSHGPGHENVMRLSAHVAVVLAEDPEKEAENKYHIRQSKDYRRALEFCAETSEFTVILEDDAFPAHDFLTIINETLIPEWTANEKLFREISYVKLYYSDTFHGWGDEDILLLATFPLGVSAGLTLVATFYLPVLKATKFRILLTFGYFTALVYTVFVLLDKQNVVWMWRPGLSPFERPCCSVAHIYTREAAVNVSQYIKDHEMTGKVVDLLLDDWAITQKRRRYIFVPNLFQHIGIFSSDTRKNQGSHRGFAHSRTFPDDLFAGQFG